MSRLIIISFFLFSLIVMGTAHSKIYKWVDEDGRVHMSDKPPRTTDFDEVKVKVNVISSPSSSAQDDVTETHQRKPVASNKKIIMYGAEWCSVCKKAKRYFKANNISFIEYDIDKSSKGRREYEKLGGRGVPVILVGKERMTP